MNTLKFSNYVFKKMWNSTFIYFTAWGLLLQILYYIGVLKKYQESVLLIVISVAFIGLVLTYIYPEKLKLQVLDYTIDKTTFQLVDLVFHQIPLILFLIMYDTNIKPDNLILGMVIILAYVILYNPYKIYGFQCACAHHKKNNVNDNNDICECRNKYNLGLCVMIVFFIIILLAIVNGIFK
mgnify:CR=1 FL=1|jgi:hypothetical protein|tara:strand:+ start:1651 stop:2193 length:543 start_codon:yes stop_codon:yes gene_type:complete